MITVSKVIFTCLIFTLSLPIYPQNTIFEKNYLIDDGIFKGYKYTGNINILGLPDGNGTMMCPNSSSKKMLKGEFINGHFQKGEKLNCKYPNKKFLSELHEGKFAISGRYKPKFLLKEGGFVEIIYKKHTPRIELTGKIIKRARLYAIIDATIHFRKNKFKIKKIKSEIFLRTLDYKAPSSYYQEWFDGLIFDGYVSARSIYDGTLYWPDGTVYEYKDEELDLEKINKIKTRLNKFKKKESRKTKRKQVIREGKINRNSEDIFIEQDIEFNEKNNSREGRKIKLD